MFFWENNNSNRDILLKWMKILKRGKEEKINGQLKVHSSLSSLLFKSSNKLKYKNIKKLNKSKNNTK